MQVLSRWTAESEEVAAAGAELCAHLASVVHDTIMLHAYVHMQADLELSQRIAVHGRDKVIKTMTAQQSRSLGVIAKEYDRLHSLHAWAATFEPEPPLKYELPEGPSSQLALDATKGLFPWIEGRVESCEVGLPKVLQSKAGVFNCRKARAEEEIALIQYEMRSSLRHYNRCIRVLQEKVLHLQQELGLIACAGDTGADPITRGQYLRGLITLLEERGAVDKGLKDEALQAFKPYIVVADYE